MARTKIEVDKSQLVNVITQLENAKKFSNRNALYSEVAGKMDISPSVVMLRVKEFDIQLKTPKGKRGRQKGVKLSTAQKAAMQHGRARRTVDNLEVLRNNFPQSKAGLIDRVGNGSLSAAIRAKCLDCCQYDHQEIKNCTCVGCPLHSFRPYQDK